MTATSRKKWLPILILVVLVAGAGVAGNLLRRSSMTDLDDQDGYSDGEDYGESDAGDYADAGDYEEGKDSGRSGARGGAGPAYDSARAGAAASRPSSGGTRQGNAARSTMRQGPCFRYLVPEGWRVVEDGQYAVVLMAPDQRAITTMVGNVGLPSNYNPQQYLYERLSQAGLGNLRFGPGRQAPAVFGFPTAYEFDVDYVVSGIPCRGLARCSVSPSYDFCTMVMTWAAAENSQWPSYSSWLPDLAGQVQV
ncbi:MAG: hypothetical protein KC729_01580, partial [Candidatus Eisenbacteria bacterium]|nr:hypothetical protein [Candidatus Eisenbacteria bacterium]